MHSRCTRALPGKKALVIAIANEQLKRMLAAPVARMDKNRSASTTYQLFAGAQHQCLTRTIEARKGEADMHVTVNARLGRRRCAIRVIAGGPPVSRLALGVPRRLFHIGRVIRRTIGVSIGARATPVIVYRSELRGASP